MARTDLKAMLQGSMDPQGRTLTQFGMGVGIASIVAAALSLVMLAVAIIVNVLSISLHEAPFAY